MDEAIERMMETWDQLHSQVSKDKGVEGQRQNVRRGYRAGGEAPYGYRRRVVTIGQHRTGQPITKSTNEPDPENRAGDPGVLSAPSGREGRSAILRDFERRGIRSPRGHVRWSTATARSFEQ
jgi:hypothetical protein